MCNLYSELYRKEFCMKVLDLLDHPLTNKQKCKTRSEAVCHILILKCKLLKQRVHPGNERTVHVFQGQTVSEVKKKCLVLLQCL